MEICLSTSVTRKEDDNKYLLNMMIERMWIRIHTCLNPANLFSKIKDPEQNLRKIKFESSYPTLKTLRGFWIAY